MLVQFIDGNPESQNDMVLEILLFKPERGLVGSVKFSGAEFLSFASSS